MNRAKNFFFLFFIISLTTSCATVGSYQSTCEQKYSSFPDIVICLKQNLKNDWRFQNSRDNDLVKLYIAFAEQLSSEVRKKTITETNAKLLLAQFYTRLKTESQYRTYRQMIAYNSYLSAYRAANYNYSSDIIENYISGTFEGWDGNTVFELDNGQVWQQASYDYYYYYAYHPRVLIYPAGGCYQMKVENVDRTICVRRLR